MQVIMTMVIHCGICNWVTITLLHPLLVSTFLPTHLSLFLSLSLSFLLVHPSLSVLYLLPSYVGVGKTTLSQKLAKELNYKLCLEPTVENPYLEKFYEEPKKYALPLQLWILQQRYLTYVDAVKHVLKTGTSKYII